MTIEADFRDITFASAITHTATSSLDGYGTVTYASSGTSYRGHLSWKAQVIRTRDGKEVVERGRCWIYGTASSINLNDKITLISGDAARVLDIDLLYDSSSPYATVIHFT